MEQTKQKTILVTGGAGFIGSNLIEELVKNPGNKVISLDNYFTGKKENHISGAEYREGHTKDIEKLIPEHVDLIYHLGEYSRVAKSIEEPALVWDLNMTGTSAVLEFWRKQKCRLVYAGSSTKFAEIRPDGISGTDLSPYTWAKSANSNLVVNYSRWYELPYVIVYFHNVFGPRELSGTYGTVVEIFKQKYLNGETLPVRLPGTQRRNYTHVADTVAGLILVGENGEGDGYGIGSSKSYSTKEVAELFGGEMEMLPARKTSRPDTTIVDTSKIKALGWEEKKSLEEYIKSIRESK